MAMNIYQKTKVIMLESNKCTAVYNKLAKILVESNDITFNNLIEKMRAVVSKGRVSGDFNGARNEIMAYCDLKIGMNESKRDLKNELKTLIEECKVRAKDFDNKIDYDDFERGCTIGRQNELEDVIDRLEKLIKS